VHVPTTINRIVCSRLID